MSYFKQVYDKLQTDIFEIWMYRKEVETLESVLAADEGIEFASAGSHGGILGLWVVTNKRLLYVHKEEEGMAVSGVAYEGIKNVVRDEYMDENQMGSLTLYFAEGDQLTITQIKEASLTRICEEIKGKITEEIVYSVEDEVGFYMGEGEQVFESLTSFYKGTMQYAYITKDKWMIFGYGEKGNEVKYGNFSDTILLETTIRLGETTWNIHAKEALGVLYLADETPVAKRFKEALLTSIIEMKSKPVVIEESEEMEPVIDRGEEEPEPASEEIDEFYQSLGEVEIDFLHLFNSGTRINHHFLFARSNGVMWSSFIDGINEKAIEYLGDLLFVEENEHCVWQEDVYPVNH